jgi:hypothetical protein
VKAGALNGFALAKKFVGNQAATAGLSRTPVGQDVHTKVRRLC